MLTDAQREALTKCCERFKQPFREDDYHPAFDLPTGWVAGWIGGWYEDESLRAIFVGCSPEGDIHS
jgi:hypothetical protein